METKFQKDSLFGGMTSNAFKLGMLLSRGWFWMRIAGCQILYRGTNMEQIDFVNILSVVDQDFCQIQPPNYLPHNNNSAYFYVIRRANNCGDQEYTLSCAVKVLIDDNGDLAQPQPNCIFRVKAEQVGGNKIQLVWFYTPLAQKSEPACFKIYYDSGTGQINYENPVATICYQGERFFSYQSEALNEGRYLFAIRAQDATGTENNSLAHIKSQLNIASPDTVNIISVETV